MEDLASPTFKMTFLRYSMLLTPSSLSLFRSSLRISSLSSLACSPRRSPASSLSLSSSVRSRIVFLAFPSSLRNWGSGREPPAEEEEFLREEEGGRLASESAVLSSLSKLSWESSPESCSWEERGGWREIVGVRVTHWCGRKGVQL